MRPSILLCRGRRDGRSDVRSRSIGTRLSKFWRHKILLLTLPGSKALRAGAGTVLTGQQVGLLGGPLFTPFKAATALARARQAAKEGKQRVPIFWLATEEHDLQRWMTSPSLLEKNSATLVYAKAPANAVPVGGVVLDENMRRLSIKPGNCLARRTRWTRWRLRTSPVLPSGRRLGSSTRKLLPRRDCWCWMRPVARCIGWARPFCGRRLSARLSRIGAAGA